LGGKVAPEMANSPQFTVTSNYKQQSDNSVLQIIILKVNVLYENQNKLNIPRLMGDW
jgi:hypothetical protein